MTFFDWLRGRKRDESPAAKWLVQRAKAEPEAVIREHFAAIAGHDLDWIQATLTPERGRLYAGPTTLDKKRLTMRTVQVVSIQGVADAPVERVPGYAEQQTYRVEYEVELAPPEERRDPSVTDGRQWAYYLIVREAPGKPWMIADWGR